MPDTPLTPKQQRIRDFIAHSIEDRGLHPTLREIGTHFGISLGAVQDHVAALAAKGVLIREPNRSRGLRLPNRPLRSSGKRLPLLGQVPAGVPIEAIQDPDDLIELDQSVAGKADYVLRVKGDSMEPEIFQGDLVLVRQVQSADDGEIIVALVDNDDATLKRLRRSAHKAWLEAANPKYSPIEGRFQVAGKIVGLIRNYGR